MGKGLKEGTMNFLAWVVYIGTFLIAIYFHKGLSLSMSPAYVYIWGFAAGVIGTVLMGNKKKPEIYLGEGVIRLNDQEMKHTFVMGKPGKGMTQH